MRLRGTRKWYIWVSCVTFIEVILLSTDFWVTSLSLQSGPLLQSASHLVRLTRGHWSPSRPGTSGIRRLKLEVQRKGLQVWCLAIETGPFGWRRMVPVQFPLTSSSFSSAVFNFTLACTASVIGAARWNLWHNACYTWGKRTPPCVSRVLRYKLQWASPITLVVQATI